MHRDEERQELSFFRISGALHSFLIQGGGSVGYIQHRWHLRSMYIQASTCNNKYIWAYFTARCLWTSLHNCLPGHYLSLGRPGDGKIRPTISNTCGVMRKPISTNLLCERQRARDMLSNDCTEKTLVLWNDAGEVCGA